MTNLQAALGLAQLEKIEMHIEKKRMIGRMYQEKLSGIDGFQLPLPSIDYAENIYWVFGLLADMKERKENMVAHLGKQKIGTRPFFWCLHEQPVFQNMGFFLGESYPVAEKLARNGFYLPSGLGLKEIEILKIIEFLQNA